MKDELIRLSDRLTLWQRGVAGCFLLAATLLILLNVVTRSAGYALFWVDELAIYSMVWAFFIGAAATVRRREMVAVSLLQGLMKRQISSLLRLAIDAVVLIFTGFLLYWCWLWYDPVLLITSGFNQDVFLEQSFNFIYRDPTNTLGFAKAWVWSIMPLASFLMALHALANVMESAHIALTGEGSDGGS